MFIQRVNTIRRTIAIWVAVSAAIWVGPVSLEASNVLGWELKGWRMAESLDERKPDSGKAFLVLEARLTNRMDASLVFDHDVPERIGVLNLSSRVFLRIDGDTLFQAAPEWADRAGYYPDTVVLSHAGSFKDIRLVFEIEKGKPESIEFLHYHEEFGPTRIMLKGASANQAELDASILRSNAVASMVVESHREYSEWMGRTAREGHHWHVVQTLGRSEWGVLRPPWYLNPEASSGDAPVLVPLPFELDHPGRFFVMLVGGHHAIMPHSEEGAPDRLVLLPDGLSRSTWVYEVPDSQMRLEWVAEFPAVGLTGASKPVEAQALRFELKPGESWPESQGGVKIVDRDGKEGNLEWQVRAIPSGGNLLPGLDPGHQGIIVSVTNRGTQSGLIDVPKRWAFTSGSLSARPESNHSPWTPNAPVWLAPGQTRSLVLGFADVPGSMRSGVLNFSGIGSIRMIEWDLDSGGLTLVDQAETEAVPGSITARKTGDQTRPRRENEDPPEAYRALPAFTRVDPVAYHEAATRTLNQQMADLGKKGFPRLKPASWEQWETVFGTATKVEAPSGKDAGYQVDPGVWVEGTLDSSVNTEHNVRLPAPMTPDQRIHLYLAGRKPDETGATFHVSILDAKRNLLLRRSLQNDLVLYDLANLPDEWMLRLENSSRESIRFRYLLELESGVRERESEDNSDSGNFTLMAPDQVISGRMVAGDSTDRYRLELPAALSDVRYNWMVVFDRADAGASGYLTDPHGNRMRARVHPDGLSLTDLVLAGGAYTFEISGSRDKLFSYHMVLKRNPVPLEHGWEMEPNDSGISVQVPVYPVGPDGNGVVYGRFSGQDTDRVVLDVPGDDVLTTVSLNSTGGARLHYAAGDGTTLRTAERKGDQPPVLVDLRLSPGRHLFILEGSDADWALSAEGHPVPPGNYEWEPNDVPSKAHLIRLGETISGRLLDSRDRDIFRLSVMGASMFRIKVSPGKGGLIDLTENSQALRRSSTGKDGSPIEMDAYLLPGNYHIQLAGRELSLHPYSLSVEPIPSWPLPEGGGLQLEFRDVAAEENQFKAAAYHRSYQRLDRSLEVKNPHDKKLTVHLEGSSTHAGVELVAPPSWTLGPRETRKLEWIWRISPDAWSNGSIHLFEGFMSDGTCIGSTRALLDLDPSFTALAEAPVPEDVVKLEGGFNLAALDFGAEVVMPSADGDKKSSSGPRLDQIQYLFDGVLSDRTFSGRQATIKLANDGRVPVIGWMFDLHGSSRMADALESYTIESSDDGQTYRTVYEGRLNPRKGAQVVALPKALNARYMRLNLLENHGKTDRDPQLGEWRVIGDPNMGLPASHPLDLLRTEWGGHEVWREKERMVFGFHHNRAARITGMVWRLAREEHGDVHRPVGEVSVRVSTQTPDGPWEDVGTYDVSPANGPDLAHEVKFEAARWARYIEFSWSASKLEAHQRYVDPLRPSIYEQPASSGYRSILGEWPGPFRESHYERAMKPSAADSGSVIRLDSSRDRPVRLEPEVWRHSVVSVGEGWEDWYGIPAAPHPRRMVLELEGDPYVRVAVDATDQQGRKIDLGHDSRSMRTRRIPLVMNPGESAMIRVYEPKRSIVFLWDMSGSMGVFQDGIESAVVNFSKEVDPATEQVQLLPFAEPPEFLLPTWGSNPQVLSDTVRNFPAPDSSHSHLNLLVAVKELAKQEGTRAAIVIADCQNARSVNDDLWKTLREVRPILYTFHTTSQTRSYGVEQDDMQDWAEIGGGRYFLVGDTYELDAAFSRVQAELRRPARYGVRILEPELGPSTIEIVDERPEDTKRDPEGEGLLLIMDMSASMLEQMPEGITRAKAAMATFSDLLEKLPDGTQLGVRVFGHRGGPNCASELILPVQPLDREKARAAINSVRVSSLGNTSIAEALDRVPEDLKAFSGVRRVVVLTDGEETCRGDPAASIANLAVAGIDTRVSIVGFEIKEDRIRKSYTDWVQAGGGRYYDASSVSSLTRALVEALTPESLPRFEILDGSMQVVASGQVGAGPVKVPSGAYRIRLEGEEDMERYGLIQAYEETVKLRYP